MKAVLLTGTLALNAQKVTKYSPIIGIDTDYETIGANAFPCDSL